MKNTFGKSSPNWIKLVSPWRCLAQTSQQEALTDRHNSNNMNQCGLHRVQFGGYFIPFSRCVDPWFFFCFAGWAILLPMETHCGSSNILQSWKSYHLRHSFPSNLENLMKLKGQRISQTLSRVCPLPDKYEKLGVDSHLQSQTTPGVWGILNVFIVVILVDLNAACVPQLWPVF